MIHRDATISMLNSDIFLKWHFGLYKSLHIVDPNFVPIETGAVRFDISKNKLVIFDGVKWNEFC